MITKSLITTLFRGFNIQRWNDKIRPVTLTEIDKNAHKMFIAYCIAKYEDPKKVNWHNIVKAGIFEYLRRVTISDIKSPVYRRIKKDKRVYAELNQWVYKQLEHCIDDATLKDELQTFLLSESNIDAHSKSILEAAHIFASYWEFKIIRQTNPDGYQINQIDQLILKDLSRHLSMEGMKKIITRQPIANFIDLFGQLRFQVRWSQTPRIPETSVLGHSMFVAVLSYLFSRQINACEQRLVNNFFGGLLHDLPEAVTRDIISPVKRSTPGMPKVIQKIEREMARDEIYKLIEPGWRKELKYFITYDDRSKIVGSKGTRFVSSEIISRSYNSDKYFPLDGQLVKAADELAAFVEAYTAKQTGITSKELEEGMHKLQSGNIDKTIAGVDITAIYREFTG